MSGRTSWWAKDAAWHRRELQVELGEEFGAAGPHVLDVISCWAQEQRAGGSVRGGFRALAREAFVEIDTVRRIVESAARMGALDDLDLDDDGRRFTCRVSGFRADQERGRAAWRQASKRDREAIDEPDSPDHTVTDRDEVSRRVTKKPPPDQTRPDQTKESPAVPTALVAREAAVEEQQDGLTRLAIDIVGLLQRGIDGLTCEEPCKAPTVPVILAALREHPVSEFTALTVAQDTRATVQAQDRAPNIAGLFKQKLAGASIGAAA